MNGFNEMLKNNQGLAIAVYLFMGVVGGWGGSSFSSSGNGDKVNEIQLKIVETQTRLNSLEIKLSEYEGNNKDSRDEIKDEIKTLRTSLENFKSEIRTLLISNQNRQK